MRSFSTLSNRGLSGIEAIVAVAVFSLVSVALVSSIIYMYRANAFAVEQAFAVENAQRGVVAMVRDIREASYADDGQFPVVSVDPYAIVLYSDIDRDNSVERVRYTLDDSTGRFLRVVTQATGTPPMYTEGTATTSVAEYVRNGIEGVPIFEYFDSTGASTMVVADVAFVRVNLVVNVNPARLPNEFTVRSSATLRNLKVNL